MIMMTMVMMMMMMLACCVCQPSVVVQQLTLDIEQYLGEVVKTTANWGHHYLAFTDYDLEIVEVSISYMC